MEDIMKTEKQFQELKKKKKKKNQTIISTYLFKICSVF